jgi:hypothetical protein
MLDRPFGIVRKLIDEPVNRHRAEFDRGLTSLSNELRQTAEAVLAP